MNLLLALLMLSASALAQTSTAFKHKHNTQHKIPKVIISTPYTIPNGQHFSGIYYIPKGTWLLETLPLVPWDTNVICEDGAVIVGPGTFLITKALSNCGLDHTSIDQKQGDK